MSETPQQMADRADFVLAKCRRRGQASVADVENLRNGIHALVEEVTDTRLEVADLVDELGELNQLPAQLEDARALAVALLSRLRDFIDDETVFGEGISWQTLPDWISGDETGRDMWKYGADDDHTINHETKGATQS